MLSPLRELNLTVTHGADTIDGRIIKNKPGFRVAEHFDIQVKWITQNITYQIASYPTFYYEAEK